MNGAAPAVLAAESAGSEEPARYVLDEQVGFVLRQVQQRHAAIFAASFGEEMTALQWSAVSRLAGVGECSQNHLGRLVATDVATIKGVVERLARRGLVETRPDPVDRRRLLLRLTSLGFDAYRTNIGRALAVTDSTLEPLAPAERATLVSLLNRLR